MCRHRKVLGLQTPNLHTTQKLKTIDQKFLMSLKNKQKSAYITNTTGFAKFQRLRILHNLLLALLNQEDKVDNESWR